MKVSVAMTTYRPVPKYLIEQLDSICFQTREVDEVVICDDCSNDGTYERIRNYIDEHGLSSTWRLVCNDENLGFTKNFSKCISLTTGDVVFLCDQDDIWLPEKVDTMCAVFERNNEVKSLVTNFYFIDECSERITLEPHGDNLLFHCRKNCVEDCLYRVDHLEALGHNIAPGATQAFTADVRNLFLRIDGKRKEHDWRISLVAALAYDGYCYYDQVLTLYRIHSANTLGLSTRYQRGDWNTGLAKRASWAFHLLKNGVSKAWNNRGRRYADRIHIKPATLDKRYFTVFDVNPAYVHDLQRWRSFAKANKRAVSKASVLRFVNIRIKYGDCVKATCGYDRLTLRFEYLLNDLNWCFFGSKKRKS